MQFVWEGISRREGNRVYHDSFTLNGESYRPGDVVQLHAAEAGSSYLAKILACVECLEDSQDPQCIEISWYERVTNLKVPPEAGVERALVELDQKDVNPIGCIAGKATVFHARCYAEACEMAREAQIADGEWFFCRGVWNQASDTFTPYATSDSKGCRSRGTASASVEDVGDSEDVYGGVDAKRLRLDTPSRLNNNMVVLDSLSMPATASEPERIPTAAARRKVTMPVAPAAGAAAGARCCVQCGVTQTPQWREGPEGPKTLCNACGVRYNRAQQRLNKRGSNGTARSSSPVGRGASARPGKGTKGAEVAQPVAAPARPMRQAALLAANRTAEFARTGAWATDDDEHTSSGFKLSAGSKRSMAEREDGGLDAKHARKQQQQMAASRDTSSHNSTDFAERGGEEEGDEQCGLPAAGTVAMAAEGGMYMGMAEGGFRAASLDLRLLAQRASSFVPGMSEYAPVLAQWEQLKDQLPGEALASLVQVGQDLERAANEAAAADAALAAVHAVLVARQEAADKARDGALAAASRMRNYMSQLSNQYPLMDSSCSGLPDAMVLHELCLQDDPLDRQDCLNQLIMNAPDTGMCGDDDLLTLGHLGPELMSA